MTAQQFAILLKGWRDQNLTVEQTREFVTAINSMEFDQLIDDTLEGHLDAGDLRKEIADQYTEQSLSLLLKRIKTDPKPAVHRVHFLRTAWFRYAAAIIIIFGIGAYLWNTTNDQGSVTKTQPVPAKNDVMPGADKAILILSDGRQVTLDATAGNVIADGNVAISNNNNGLVYSSSSVSVNNTMTTPRGGQYQLTLADGTKVWLNAVSTITYPTAFTGKTREVQITGEAYFEVAKNKEKPFIVKTRKESITVLGTSFNINAYPDESLIKTSLIDGSIKVSPVDTSPEKGKVLKPGQAYENNKVKPTNIEQDMAWKNGLFNFNNLPLEKAMQQIARWYDVEVVYDKGIPDVELFGEIKRKLSIVDLLSGFEGTVANFTLKGRTVYVRPLSK